MAGIESWGTSLILWLQSFHGPAADAFFKLATLLGDEKFYLVLLPLVYWCIDKRLGIRLALLVMLSDWVNQAAKFTFNLPRPSAPPVRLISTEMGPGFPSGHTQAATVAFGYLAVRIQRWGMHLLAAAVVFLVALSRMYLGVHYPHDVLGGLILGYAVLFLFVRTAPRLERTWGSWPGAARYALAAGVPALALLVTWLLWPTTDAAGSLGALAGFGLGGLIEAERIHFSAGGSALRRLVRFLVGFAGVGVLYFGLEAVVPDTLAWDAVRYACVGLFASAAAPWLFLKLGLAEREVPAVQLAEAGSQ